MKKLLVVRHAKSSWESDSLRDFDRPLNDRGHRDAPEMALRLWDKGLRPDALVSSPANRALTTAKYFHKQAGVDKIPLITVDALYHAPCEVFYQVITRHLLDEWQTVFIFSHNPGITEFVNSLGLVRLDNMPTCAVFGVKVEINKWQDFSDARKMLLLFDYPKNQK